MNHAVVQKPNTRVAIGNVTFANDAPIAVFAGPCQMESRSHALEMASAFSLPPVTDGQVASMPLKSACAWPPTTAVTASAPPL